MGDQQSMLQELASQLQVVATDVKGLGRYSRVAHVAHKTQHGFMATNTPRQ